MVPALRSVGLTRLSLLAAQRERRRRLKLT
jgi:hypothetical protein